MDARDSVVCWLGPGPGRWPFWQLGARPTHVPAHELPQYLRARTAPRIGMGGTGGVAEREPLVVRRSESAGRVVLVVVGGLGRHAPRGLRCGPNPQNPGAPSRWHKS